MQLVDGYDISDEMYAQNGQYQQSESYQVETPFFREDDIFYYDTVFTPNLYVPQSAGSFPREEYYSNTSNVHTHDGSCREGYYYDSQIPPKQNQVYTYYQQEENGQFESILPHPTNGNLVSESRKFQTVQETAPVTRKLQQVPQRRAITQPKRNRKQLRLPSAKKATESPISEQQNDGSDLSELTVVELKQKESEHLEQQQLAKHKHRKSVTCNRCKIDQRLKQIRKLLSDSNKLSEVGNQGYRRSQSFVDRNKSLPKKRRTSEPASSPSECHSSDSSFSGY